MTKERIGVYAHLLDQCRRETLKTVGGLGSEARFLQLKPGKATPCWLVGHLATAAQALVLVCTLGREPVLGEEFTGKFAPDFAGGTPPSGDPGAYPPWDEVMQAYQDIMEAAVVAVRGELNDQDLRMAPKRMPDELAEFFPTVESVLDQMILHDSYHRGQIAILPKLR